MKYQYQAVDPNGKEISVNFEGEGLEISAQILDENASEKKEGKVINFEHKFSDYEKEIKDKSLDVLQHYLKKDNKNNKIFVLLDEQPHMIYSFEEPITYVTYSISNIIDKIDDNIFSAQIFIGW